VFRLIAPAEIEQRWPELSLILTPAIRINAGATVQSVYDRLLASDMHMIEGAGPAEGLLLVFRVFPEGEQVSCFASYLSGRVKSGPLLKTMRLLMAAFEDHCRGAGVHQLYIGGRNWSRVFPDYEPVDDVTNRLRKVLIHG
jgi:hypothetical protein